MIGFLSKIWWISSWRTTNYKELVKRLIEDYKDMGCKMSIKIYFLHTHLTCFPDNLGDQSDGQGERFHRDLMVMEKKL
uniref:Putative LOC100901472 [Metaseiulus occidentalis] n=1 Tax=Lepeophtheirus salmonis TaxID=72036 RepID=A0A0K2UZR5_LEPSM